MKTQLNLTVSERINQEKAEKVKNDLRSDGIYAEVMPAYRIMFDGKNFSTRDVMAVEVEDQPEKIARVLTLLEGKYVREELIYKSSLSGESTTFFSYDLRTKDHIDELRPKFEEDCKAFYPKFGQKKLDFIVKQKPLYGIEVSGFATKYVHMNDKWVKAVEDFSRQDDRAGSVSFQNRKLMRFEFKKNAAPAKKEKAVQ